MGRRFRADGRCVPVRPELREAVGVSSSIPCAGAETLSRAGSGRAGFVLLKVVLVPRKKRIGGRQLPYPVAWQSLPGCPRSSDDRRLCQCRGCVRFGDRPPWGLARSLADKNEWLCLCTAAGLFLSLGLSALRSQSSFRLRSHSLLGLLGLGRPKPTSAQGPWAKGLCQNAAAASDRNPARRHQGDLGLCWLKHPTTGRAGAPASGPTDPTISTPSAALPTLSS